MNEENREFQSLKSEHFKLSPSTTRYHRVMKLAEVRNCDWQEVIRNAIDMYLENYELLLIQNSKKSTPG